MQKKNEKLKEQRKNRSNDRTFIDDRKIKEENCMQQNSLMCAVLKCERGT